jgi:hypothetical protein
MTDITDDEAKQLTDARESESGEARRVVIPFSQENIAPGKTFTVWESDRTVNERKGFVFQAKQVHVSHQSADFLIVLTIDGKPQWDAGIPAGIFSPLLCKKCKEEISPGFDPKMKLTECPSPDDAKNGRGRMFFVVKNMGSAPASFNASIVGTKRKKEE